MDAQIKTLIDRTVPRFQEIIGKESMERTHDGFHGFMLCLDDAKEKGVVYGVGAWRKGDIINSKAMDQAYEMGKNI